ncbi:MAG: ATP synthase F0 subunit C [Chloroflexota bacterium]
MDVEAAQVLAEALGNGLRLVGAGLAMTGAIGAGAGIGLVVGGAVQGIARNPDTAGAIQTNMILGIAFAEAVAIYALVVALIILFVG